ncbi:penicillin-binding protein [Bacteroides fragilis]|uniref:penicillin-binding transpeptidase domain-containing protein n=1 Tax=Bacteroides fragilis TaxID=817 RepID=UPI002030AE5C|nr:penicillin-binding transpeptidase domain-containing protein [Bacteroides fragilis]MCM0383659.1 penicillin-binding protein [Bacteroides fragilis]
MKSYILIIITICLTSCQPKQHKVEQLPTIDSTLQVKATFVLESKLSEINAQSGQVIIMEVQTGQIKALVGLARKDSADYQPCENFSVQSPTSLMHPISLLAALETGKVNLSDKVDVGNGIYSVHGRELKDRNWQRGGYGEITVEQGLICNSNIANYKTMEKAFSNNSQSYFDLLAKMNYGKSDSIAGISNLKPAQFITPKSKNWNNTSLAWFSIGYNQLIAPIQTLTFYNAIANNGKMVQPLFYKDSTVVINPQIASKSSIDSLKQALNYNITGGLGKPAYSDKVKIEGIQGAIQLENENYIVEFCGYFPTDSPQYTIIVSINKMGLPVSGGLMAGDVFRQIVEYIITHININH